MSALLAQVPYEDVDIIPSTEYNNLTQLRPSGYLKTTINLLLGAAGVLSFIFLLWGGIQWILAGGDKEAVEKARKKIIAALVGLAIVFSAYATLYAVRVLFNVNLIQIDLAPLGSGVYGGSGSGSGSGSGPAPTSNPSHPGMCGCGGPPGWCMAPGGSGALTFGGNCWTCTLINPTQAIWVEQPNTPGCPIATCTSCP